MMLAKNSIFNTYNMLHDEGRTDESELDDDQCAVIIEPPVFNLTNEKMDMINKHLENQDVCMKLWDDIKIEEIKLNEKMIVSTWY